MREILIRGGDDGSAWISDADKRLEALSAKGDPLETAQTAFQVLVAEEAAAMLLGPARIAVLLCVSFLGQDRKIVILSKHLLECACAGIVCDRRMEC